MAARSEDPAVPHIHETRTAGAAGEPKRLAIDKDHVDAEAVRRKSRLRYSVAALIVLDLIAGTLFHLHAPDALRILSFANFAIFGLSGVIRLLPDKERERVLESAFDWARRPLSSASGPRVIAGVLTLVLFVACFTSSVHVRSTGGATAEVRVVKGSESQSDTNAIQAAHTLRLAQSGGEVSNPRWVWPWDNSMWAYTRTHVSRGDRNALPWKPVRWTYPTDFDEQVALFILPLPAAVGKLKSDKPDLVLRDLRDREILRSPIGGAGARVQFSDGSATASELAAAWAARYRERLLPADSFAFATDSILIIALLAPNDTSRRRHALKRHDDAVELLDAIPERVDAWRGAVHVRPNRPLHLGEKVRYAFDRGDPKTRFIDLVLDRNPYFVFLDSATLATTDAPADP